MRNNILLLRRSCHSSFGTFGVLYLCTGIYEFPICQTLEPVVCDGKSSHGVLPGSYDFAVTYSPKFRRNLPLLTVPGRDGIRIHAGNSSDDTFGCILVGSVGSSDGLRLSRIALNYLLEIIKSLKLSTIKIIDNERVF